MSANATSPEETLLYESRLRTRQVIVAVVAGVLLFVAAAIQLTGAHTSVNEGTLSLLTFNKRFPLDLISSVISAIATLAATWTLVFLWQAARNRNPEKVRPFIRTLVLVGGVLDAVVAVAYAAVLSAKAHDFATTGDQTYAEYNRLVGGSGLLILQLVGFFGALLVAIGFVLVSLHAMNQGLLSRFMGYLGMFAGALVLFQILQLPVVQSYWLLAVAYLMSGRWPSGVPPAWRSGRAEPWPSSAEMRTRRAAASGRGAGRGVPRPQPATAGAPETATAEGAAGRTRAATPKRKRKRRG